MPEETPIPLAYTNIVRGVPQSYNSDDYNTNYNPSRIVSTQTSASADKSVFESDTESLVAPSPPSKERSALLIYLCNFLIYTRVFSILVIVISLGLIVSGIASFERAKKDPSNPLDHIPKQAQINDQPCIVFSGIATMNLVLSGGVLVLYRLLSKVSNRFNLGFVGVKILTNSHSFQKA